ncbi:hypothetical protein AMATHDRAFT_139737 [Amanita thiersii Skay4041]|uniref:Inosine/uridine-preferring nucleoside hydrolase domain-containing protein n=1 Tax=Amanita thiersii Skay4041 TaxID=703135 RepID=A0A2A9NT82_9AGAR|nr:hypothetical protein AMATHDRAFT_139737 [Amanita thiersii Skay4041]
MVERYVWLDVDPVRHEYRCPKSLGHDDALAILLAVHEPNVKLLGVSTTHGNAPGHLTAINAARCLYAFGAPSNVHVYPGASKPLILPTRHDPEIHGPDGLGGVEGLPDASHPQVQARFSIADSGAPMRAIEGMSSIIRDTWKNGTGRQVTIISTGPMTNIALFVSVHPDLLEAIDELVFMGGAVGTGNRSAAAEYNIIVDPHAAQISLNAPIRKVMIPLNVTHTAIATAAFRSQLITSQSLPNGPPALKVSKLRHLLSTLIGFFADAYKSTFGFNDGPPVHDALTIAYVSHPELFKSTRYRVDVELSGTFTLGETVVDIWNYRSCDDSWGSQGKNCIVTQEVDVPGFFEMLLDCVASCDKLSPVNSTQ